MSQTANPVPAAAQVRPVLVYDGDVGDLFGVYLLNLIFSILTFGIFRFWAITRLRRYLWSHMRFENTRFTYTGKGSEIFLGFLLAMLILIVFAIGIGFSFVMLRESHPVLAMLPVVFAYLALFALFGAAHFSAQRYRLSRTEWRGIRGGMTGSALAYGVKWLLFFFLSIITLYQAVPWMQVGLVRRRINASRFGSAEFRCDSRARHLYLTWLATLVGTVVLLIVIFAVGIASEWASLSRVFADPDSPAAGIAIRRSIPIIIIGILVFLIFSGLLATWYYTRMLRLLLDNTVAIVPSPSGQDTLRFATTVTAGNLLWLVAGNVLIAIFTFGFGVPIVLHRTAKYIARTTLMTGTFDADHLVQSTLARPTFGEGFLQALDPGIV
jgi:uncharacterized membrane protein YjgN (DUF898 family)